jgi:phosphoenolpyruvate carboxylase
MANTSDEISSDTLSAEIRQLGRILGEVIVKLEGREVFDLEEKLRLLAKSSRAGTASADRELEEAVRQLSVAEAAHMAMAFTVYFELVNLAE